MSSDFNAFISFFTKVTNLYRTAGLILVILGTLSSILNLFVFSKRNLRKSPCSIYFRGINIVNLCFIYSIIFIFILRNGFGIDPISSNLISCRLSFYVQYVLDILNPSFLILASIDRILLTSSNTRTRQRSTRRLAYLCIALISVFWFLIHIHTFFYITVLQFGPSFFMCAYQTGDYFVAISYYMMIVKSVSAPLLMAVLGLWTVRNIRKRKFIANPHLNRFRTSQKDRQLIRILSVDIIVYISSTLMLTTMSMYQQITQYQFKSMEQYLREMFIYHISLVCSFIPSCIGCYTNIIVSKTFRNEIKTLFSSHH